MKNLRRDNKKKSIENKFLKKKSFYFLTLLSILIAIFFSPKISIAEPSKAIIGPLSVLGQIPVTDQQILFNRFREQLNKGYHLISHKVIELIYDQGLKIEMQALIEHIIDAFTIIFKNSEYEV